MRTFLFSCMLAVNDRLTVPGCSAGALKAVAERASKLSMAMHFGDLLGEGRDSSSSKTDIVCTYTLWLWLYSRP